MERSKLKELFGGKYIVDHTSKRIHKVSAIVKKCRIGMLKRAEYCGKRKMMKYLRMGYTMCFKCFVDANTDLHKG